MIVGNARSRRGNPAAPLCQPSALPVDASFRGVDSEEESMVLVLEADGERGAELRRIRDLNDAFRRTHIGGTVVLTAGVAALSSMARSTVVQKVRDFTEFNPDNDPHHEHDFGSFDHDGRRLFWKIDYYSPDMQGGSEDPSDPDETQRVLTIMFAEEY